MEKVRAKNSCSGWAWARNRAPTARSWPDGGATRPPSPGHRPAPPLPRLQHLRKEIPSTWTIPRPGSARPFPSARAPGTARSPARATLLTSQQAADHRFRSRAAPTPHQQRLRPLHRRESSVSRPLEGTELPAFHYGPAVDDPLDGHLRPECVHRWATREPLMLRPSLLARVRRRFAGAHPRAAAAAPLRRPARHRYDNNYGKRCALPGGYLAVIFLAVGEHPPVNGCAPGLDPHKLQSWLVVPHVSGSERERVGIWSVPKVLLGPFWIYDFLINGLSVCKLLKRIVHRRNILKMHKKFC